MRKTLWISFCTTQCRADALIHEIIPLCNRIGKEIYIKFCGNCSWDGTLYIKMCDNKHSMYLHHHMDMCTKHTFRSTGKYFLAVPFNAARQTSFKTLSVLTQNDWTIAVIPSILSYARAMRIYLCESKDLTICFQKKKERQWDKIYLAMDRNVFDTTRYTTVTTKALNGNRTLPCQILLHLF